MSRFHQSGNPLPPRHPRQRQATLEPLEGRTMLAATQTANVSFDKGVFQAATATFLTTGIVPSRSANTTVLVQVGLSVSTLYSSPGVVSDRIAACTVGIAIEDPETGLPELLANGDNTAFGSDQFSISSSGDARISCDFSVFDFLIADSLRGHLDVTWKSAGPVEATTVVSGADHYVISTKLRPAVASGTVVLTEDRINRPVLGYNLIPDKSINAFVGRTASKVLTFNKTATPKPAADLFSTQPVLN